MKLEDENLALFIGSFRSENKQIDEVYMKASEADDDIGDKTTHLNSKE